MTAQCMSKYKNLTYSILWHITCTFDTRKLLKILQDAPYTLVIKMEI